MLIKVMPSFYLIIGKLDDTNLILVRASFENSNVSLSIIISKELISLEIRQVYYMKYIST